MKKTLSVLALLLVAVPAFVLAESAPTVSRVEPSAPKVGETVYVYGTNFNSSTYIGFDGSYGTSISPRSITVISPTSLSFVVPSSLSARTHTLAVAEKGGSGDLSTSVDLTVIPDSDPNSEAPTISYIEPTTARTGDTIYVYGSNFNQYAYVYLDGGYGPTVTSMRLSPTTLKFVLPSVNVGSHEVFVGEKGSSWPAGSPVRLNVVGNYVDVTPSVTPISTSDSQRQEKIMQLQRLLILLMQQLNQLLQER